MAEASVPPALASAADFQIRYPSLCQDAPGSSASYLADLMVEATSALEDLTTRRLAPFVNLSETHPLFGIDPEEWGNDNGMPLPWAGSLGLSMASAMGVHDLVRKCWLREYAPRYPELWTYSVQSITLHLSVGGTYEVDVANLEGPWADSGMMRFQPGTYAPEGTTAAVVYSGGYTATPPSLKRACCMQAAMLLILDMEPQSRPGLDLNELELQLTKTVAAWARA